MKERTYSLYLHNTPSNKKYVGITCKPVKNRWASGAGYTQNKHFYRAIQKYGWDNIQHIIICNNLSKEWACKLEQDFIRIYDTNNPKHGYNLSIGGEYSSLGCKASDETKQRLSLSLKGKNKGKFSEAHKKALSLAWEQRKEKGLGVPWNKGKALKDTGKIDNFIKAGKKNAEFSQRRVYQIDLVTGKILKEHPSVIAAARSLGKCYSSSIFGVLKGKRKSALGYFWKYKSLTRMGE